MHLRVEFYTNLSLRPDLHISLIKFENCLKTEAECDDSVLNPPTPSQRQEMPPFNHMNPSQN